MFWRPKMVQYYRSMCLKAGRDDKSWHELSKWEPISSSSSSSVLHTWYLSFPIWLRVLSVCIPQGLASHSLWTEQCPSPKAGPHQFGNISDVALVWVKIHYLENKCLYAEKYHFQPRSFVLVLILREISSLEKLLNTYIHTNFVSFNKSLLKTFHWIPLRA